MSTRLPLRFFLLLGLIVPSLLAGCGGGGGGGGSSTPSPFAGTYVGTVTTGNNNVTTPATFIVDAGGTVSTTFAINGVSSTYSAGLGNVDANGNFQTQVTSPVQVIFTGTIKPDAGTGLMRIVGDFFIPTTGLRGTYNLLRN